MRIDARKGIEDYNATHAIPPSKPFPLFAIDTSPNSKEYDPSLPQRTVALPYPQVFPLAVGKGYHVTWKFQASFVTIGSALPVTLWPDTNGTTTANRPEIPELKLVMSNGVKTYGRTMGFVGVSCCLIGTFMM